jgi:hypothetical protein
MVPYVANRLIADDMDVSEETAYEEMIASGDAGESLHPHDDNGDEMEKILKSTFINRKKNVSFRLITNF